MKIIKQSDVYAIIQKYISSHSTIVEVGAFTGHDTIRMAKFFPTSTIHAFEPVPELYKTLTANVAAFSHVKTYPYAVSNSNSTKSLYLAQKANGRITQASSLQKPKERLAHSPIMFPTQITVPTITLTTWSHTQDITTIDLLWLDTQGHEMVILTSVKALLSHITMIYTEVGFIEAYEEQRDASLVIEFLRSANFTPIAQDFNNPPSWFFGNILFVRNDMLK